MKYLVISDIHGDTDYIRQFTDSLGSEADYLTPYHGQQAAGKRSNESQYAFFKRVSSIDNLTAKARSTLQAAQEPVVVIGFSVGATSAWQLAAMPDLPIRQCICVFGSRIRDHLHLTPTVPTTAFFSNDERYFYEQVIASPLLHKQRIDCPHDAISSIAQPGILVTQLMPLLQNAHSERQS
ncbi:hypothetical protein [Pseudoalteromonas 'SMAR']|uniref:hypothetical protein n=1 Tax=Pseudoalteromonas 'SMAR' TaxID=3416908 RepID=UPI003AF2B0D5